VRKTVGISREKPVYWVKHGIQIWEVASVFLDEKAVFKSYRKSHSRKIVSHLEKNLPMW
jgi:uncharacterized DUF497 family protein